MTEFDPAARVEAEYREALEGIGGSVDDAFSRHSDSLVTTDTGRSLKMYGAIDNRTGRLCVPEAFVTETQLDDGRHIDLIYKGVGYPSAIRVTEKDGASPTITAGQALEDNTWAPYVRRDGDREYDAANDDFAKSLLQIWRAKNLPEMTTVPPRISTGAKLGAWLRNKTF